MKDDKKTDKKTGICLISDSFPPLIDGVANAVVNYAEIINQGLGNASVVTPYYPDTDDSQYDFPVIRIPSLDTTKLVGYRAGLTADPLVMKKIEDLRFDIIHSHCPITSTFLARKLRTNTDVPIVLTYHTKYDVDIRNSIKGELLQEGAIRALVNNISACDEVWAVSRGAGENLRSLGYEGDYSVMPNGVDFPRGKVHQAEIDAVCAGYDLPENVPCYLFVGRIMWYKGLRVILDALKRLAEGGKDFRMLFIGKGADKDKVAAYSRGLGLDKKVLFVDPVYDRNILRAWYSRADLFLFPSTFDTNGLVVREAAACGLASVLIRGSCAAEDTSDGENCYWIEADPESLYMLLLKAGFSIPDMKRIGQRAQDQLYCSWDDSVNRAFDRYQVIIEKYRSGDYRKERAERQRVPDIVGDAYFRASAHTLQSFVDMERDADRLISEAWGRIQELKGNYLFLKDSLAEIKIRLSEIRNHVDYRTLEHQIKAQLEMIEEYLKKKF